MVNVPHSVLLQFLSDTVGANQWAVLADAEPTVANGCGRQYVSGVTPWPEAGDSTGSCGGSSICIIMVSNTGELLYQFDVAFVFIQQFSLQLQMRPILPV